MVDSGCYAQRLRLAGGGCVATLQKIAQNQKQPEKINNSPATCEPKGQRKQDPLTPYDSLPTRLKVTG